MAVRELQGWRSWRPPGAGWTSRSACCVSPESVLAKCLATALNVVGLDGAPASPSSGRVCPCGSLPESSPLRSSDCKRPVPPPVPERALASRGGRSTVPRSSWRSPRRPLLDLFYLDPGEWEVERMHAALQDGPTGTTGAVRHGCRQRLHQPRVRGRPLGHRYRVGSRAYSVSFNTRPPWHGCIHSHPYLGTIPAGCSAVLTVTSD